MFIDVFDLDCPWKWVHASRGASSTPIWFAALLVSAAPPILTRTFEIVTPSPVPHLLPGCLITSSSTAENGFAIAGIIASIVYETSRPCLLFEEGL